MSINQNVDAVHHRHQNRNSSDNQTAPDKEKIDETDGQNCPTDRVKKP